MKQIISPFEKWSVKNFEKSDIRTDIGLNPVWTYQ